MNDFDNQFVQPLCGIDEVGRGPLCGPVVASCIMIKKQLLQTEEWLKVNDSKKLTSKRREVLYDFILKNCYIGIGRANPQEIDQLNIHHATLLAMKRAFENMIVESPTPSMALIDGKFSPDLPCQTQTVIKGDSVSRIIGAASIVAKVTRDREMVTLHQQYPGYGWDRNAGYGTKEHLSGLEKNGLTAHHRLSFSPCKKIMKKKK